MDVYRGGIYDKTKEFLNGRLMNILVFSLLICLVNFAIITIGSSSAIGILGEFIRLLMRGNLIGVLEFGSEIGDLNIITRFCRILIVTALNAGLSISILGSYRSSEKVQFKGIIEAFKENLKELLVAIFIISTIVMLVSFVPFVGWLLAIIVEYGLAFYSLLIKDKKTKSALSAVIDSYKLTRGHKRKLFLLDMHYLFRVSIGFVIYIAGFIISFRTDFFERSGPGNHVSATIVVLFGVVTLIVLAIRYLPYMVTAKVIYYEVLQEKKNEVLLEGELSENMSE